MKFTRLLVLLLALLLTLPIRAIDEAPAIAPALRDHLLGLESATESIRGLERLRDVELRFPSREEARAFLAATLNESLSEDELARQLRFYTALELLPPGFDLAGTLVELYGQQVAGYYDDQTQSMNVIFNGPMSERRLQLLEQIIFVHEYVHALQDQHFTLSNFISESFYADPLNRNYDFIVARLALIEGDATYVMNLYTMAASQANPLGALAELLIGGLRAGNLTLPPGLPEVLAEELTAPYLIGEGFVQALYREGGWERVDAAYSAPPASMEQVLHPEKYLTHHLPIPVSLPDASARLGADWSLVDQGTMGEFYLRLFLRGQLAAAQANSAAQGWGGDTFQIYSGPDGELALRLEIVWDSPAEAEEFHAAFLDYLMQRGNPSADGRCSLLLSDSLCMQPGMDRTRIVRASSSELEQALFAD